MYITHKTSSIVFALYLIVNMGVKSDEMVYIGIIFIFYWNIKLEWEISVEFYLKKYWPKRRRTLICQRPTWGFYTLDVVYVDQHIQYNLFSTKYTYIHVFIWKLYHQMKICHRVSTTKFKAHLWDMGTHLAKEFWISPLNICMVVLWKV